MEGRKRKGRENEINISTESSRETKTITSASSARYIATVEVSIIISHVEHEQCIRDILELKWHVSFEGRQLERIEDDVKIVVDTNTHLKV